MPMPSMHVPLVDCKSQIETIFVMFDHHFCVLARHQGVIVTYTSAE